MFDDGQMVGWSVLNTLPNQETKTNFYLYNNINIII